MQEDMQSVKGGSEVQEAFDLSYNIAALCVAILDESIATSEQAFNAIEDKQLNSVYNEQDTIDMANMIAQGMTYRKVGKIYGLKRDTIFDRVKRYKKKTSLDCSPKRSMKK